MLLDPSVIWARPIVLNAMNTPLFVSIVWVAFNVPVSLPPLA